VAVVGVGFMPNAPTQVALYCAATNISAKIVLASTQSGQVLGRSAAIGLSGQQAQVTFALGREAVEISTVLSTRGVVESFHYLLLSLMHVTRGVVESFHHLPTGSGQVTRGVVLQLNPHYGSTVNDCNVWDYVPMHSLLLLSCTCLDRKS
jgi:hypothetical protein